jgi:hypothetical protein
MVKIAQIYFLLFLISFQSWGLFLVVPFAGVSASLNYWISEKNTIEVYYSSNAFNGLKWHNHKEIIIADKFYDIEDIQNNEDGFLVKLVKDDFESKIMNKCYKFIHKIYKSLQISIKSILAGFLAIIPSANFIFIQCASIFSTLHLLWGADKLLDICLNLLYPPPK